jgi:hypothetical protein
MPAARHLAAILAADVAGYSRLMGEDEDGTLAALNAVRREVTDPKINLSSCHLRRRQYPRSGERHDYSCSATLLALDVERAAVQFRQRPCQRQSQAGTLMSTI